MRCHMHQLQSHICHASSLVFCFQVIDLGDSMTFDPIPGQADALTCNVEDIPTDDSNLVLKVCHSNQVAFLLHVTSLSHM